MLSVCRCASERPDVLGVTQSSIVHLIHDQILSALLQTRAALYGTDGQLVTRDHIGAGYPHSGAAALCPPRVPAIQEAMLPQMDRATR